MLAIKPQTLPAAAPTIAPLVGPDTLLVSIVAGKTIADLRARIPGARAIVRAMPNLPASVRRGATGRGREPAGERRPSAPPRRRSSPPSAPSNGSTTRP